MPFNVIPKCQREISLSNRKGKNTSHVIPTTLRYTHNPTQYNQDRGGVIHHTISEYTRLDNSIP